MEKHKAVVMGEVHLERYYFGGNGWYSSFRYIAARGEYKENKVIWSGELDNPPIEEGEKLYIAELKMTVKITSKEKSTEGGYIYVSDHIEMIEDEETQRTLEIAKKHEKEYEERIASEPKIEKGNKWWKFWEK
jgi:hypothetical protein